MALVCRDTGPQLTELLRDAAAQSCPPDEIIVVDDGSVEAETLEVLGRLSHPARVIHRDGGGAAAALNLAVRHALGEFICFVSPRTRCDPTLVERLMGPLQATSAGWTSCPVLMEQGQVVPAAAMPRLLVVSPGDAPWLTRTSTLLTVGGWDEAIPDQEYATWDLWIRLVSRDHAGTILPTPLSRSV